jgi:exopolysaccharide production protein ExoZ
MPVSVRKIESVQLLRATAAVGVILFHAAGLLAARTGYSSPWSRLGAAGVDLFFVVSGFIMWVTAMAREEGAQHFLLKRAIRIIPLYWLVTALVLVIALAKPDLMRYASHEPAHFAASFAFIAWPHPILQGRFWPPVVPGWTLNYEALFYLVVAASLMLRKAWRGPFLAVVLVGLASWGMLLHPTQLLSFYTDPIVLEFLLGAAIGMSFEPLQPDPKWASGLALVGITLFLTLGRLGTDENRVLTWGLPLSVLVLGAVHLPLSRGSRLWRWAIALGDASYSIYLTQFLVLPAAALVLGHLLGHAGGPVEQGVFVTGLVGASLAGGIGTYYMVERPVLRALKGLLAASRDAVGAAPLIVISRRAARR